MERKLTALFKNKFWCKGTLPKSHIPTSLALERAEAGPWPFLIVFYLQRESPSLLLRILRGSSEVMERKDLSEKWSLNKPGLPIRPHGTSQKESVFCRGCHCSLLLQPLPRKQSSRGNDIRQDRGPASCDHTYWASNGVTYRDRK